ncbi:hypothetical protein [Exiguobacterium undae]
MSGIRPLKSSLICSVILSSVLSFSHTASADSGESTLPKKDPNSYYYKLYAPKSQTSYKQFSTAIQKVSDIKKDNSKLLMYGGIVSGGGAFGSSIKAIENVPYVGTAVRVATGTGGVMTVVGGFGQIKYSKFKKDSLVMHKTYFKWTNAARLEYDVKIKSWVQYKGKRITKVETRTFSKIL